MSEDYVLACQPMTYKGHVLPGSLPSKCSQCGQAIWISPPSMIIAHNNPSIVTLCWRCAVEHKATYKGVFLDLASAQIEEIANILLSH